MLLSYFIHLANGFDLDQTLNCSATDLVMTLLSLVKTYSEKEHIPCFQKRLHIIGYDKRAFYVMNLVFTNLNMGLVNSDSLQYIDQ